MTEKPIVIVIDRRLLRPILAVAGLCLAVLPLSSEQLTLSTSYPAPVGVYTYLITTGAGGRNTVLARSAGMVGVGGEPQEKLHVVGGAFRVEAPTPIVRLYDTSAAGGQRGWQLQSNGSLYIGPTNDSFAWAGPAASISRAGDVCSGGGKCLSHIQLYRCPAAYSANGVSSGPWASYGCNGQLQVDPGCYVTVFPQTQRYDCPPAN